MATFTYAGGAVSSMKDINALKGQGLLDLYNALTGKSTKKFGSAAAGMAQTKKAFTTWLKQQPKEPGSGNGKQFRKDGPRGQVITLASKAGGATWKELKDATEWDDDALGGALSKIESYHGLTVTKTGEGDARVIVISGEIQSRKPFDLKPGKKQKTCQPKSKRGILLEKLLNGGATFDEVKALTGWNNRYAYEGIRLINSYVGYGVREGTDGKIHAYAA